MCPLISIKNTWKVEKHDFIVQSCNTLDQKLQNFGNDPFITSSNSMIIYEYGCWIFLRQLNEEKINMWWYHVIKKHILIFQYIYFYKRC
jgi:hypothetical protein